MRERKIAIVVLSGCLAAWSFVRADGARPAGKLVKVKLGPQVNSAIREGFPIVGPDGKTLYFIRERYVDSDIKNFMDQMPKTMDEKSLKEFQANLLKIKDKLDMPFALQTIWASERGPDGTWGPAFMLPRPVNNENNAFVFGVFPDNNTLFICRPPAVALPQFVPGDHIVALTSRTTDGWSEPKYLNIKGFANTSPRFGFAIAPSHKALLAAISNAQSLGGIDIYISFPEPDGSWSTPKNLGPIVNSPRNEYGMFFAPDDQTVYFASDRAGGYGGVDVYMTRRLDDTWLRWSAPKNLGPEINDEKNQESLSVDASGQYAFTAEGSRMAEDIYEFALPPDVRPIPVAFVRGRVHDPGDKPLGASIAYERLRDGFPSGMAGSHPATGRYQIALPLGEEYGFLAGAEGYYSVSENIDLRSAAGGQVFERDLTLIPIQTQTPIRLNNIFFDSDKAELLPASRRELERLVQLLNRYPAMVIEIRGHTDSQNTADYNLTLSNARARAVVEYLVKEGIAAARLTWKGFGLALPVASNETKEGRQLNRRVEFMIVKM